jgi:hypothetical protein
VKNVDNTRTPVMEVGGRQDFNILSAYMRYSLLLDCTLNVFSGEAPKDTLLVVTRVNHLNAQQRTKLWLEFEYIMEHKRKLFLVLKNSSPYSKVKGLISQTLEKAFPMLDAITVKTSIRRKLERTPVFANCDLPHELGLKTESMCIIEGNEIFRKMTLLADLSVDSALDVFLSSKRKREISVSPPPGAVFGIRRKVIVEMTEREFYDHQLRRGGGEPMFAAWTDEPSDIGEFAGSDFSSQASEYSPIADREIPTGPSEPPKKRFRY